MGHFDKAPSGPPGSAADRSLLRDTRHVLQPPGGAASGPMPSMVQRSSDPAQRVAALTQPADLIQHLLLSWLRLEVLSVGGKPIAELDVAHSLAVGTLWLMASRVRSPIASRSH